MLYAYREESQYLIKLKQTENNRSLSDELGRTLIGGFGDYFSKEIKSIAGNDWYGFEPDTIQGSNRAMYLSACRKNNRPPCLQIIFAGSATIFTISYMMPNNTVRSDIDINIANNIETEDALINNQQWVDIINLIEDLGFSYIPHCMLLGDSSQGVSWYAHYFGM